MLVLSVDEKYSQICLDTKKYKVFAKCMNPLPFLVKTFNIEQENQRWISLSE